MLAGNHLFLVAHTNRKTSQIVIFLRHQARVLCSLSANESSLRLKAAFRNALYDIRDLLRIVLAAGDVIQEE